MATPSFEFDVDVPTREAIARALREGGQDWTAATLAQHLGVKRPATQTGFDRRLGAMIRDGQVLSDRSGHLTAVAADHFVAGKVQGHRDGFGFLLRDDGGRDLFLSPREMLKVMHGDRVLARETGEYRGKPEAQIIEVTEHATRRLVGRYYVEDGVALVAPEDQRNRREVHLVSGGANGARHGQVVEVELLRHPTRQLPAEGRIVEILGEIDDPGMEIEIAVRKFDVPHVFSDATEAAAAKLPRKVRKIDLKGRHDLRDVPFLTIDGLDARDFDDAVYCEPIELGQGNKRHTGWRLLVAIADVSHYVTPGSPLDDDALQRATSVYFPRRVIPMLPEVLSNGLCSLNPHVDRLSLVCDMVIAGSGPQAGSVLAYQFFDAVIHSCARTTYDQVWAHLQGRPEPEQRGIAPLPEIAKPVLAHLHTLFGVLRTARVGRGAVDVDTIETRMVCDENGRIERIEPMQRNDAHRLIEECMLAANTCAADFLLRSRHPGLFRIHEGPNADRLEALRAFLKTLGLSLGGGNEPKAADYGKLLQSVEQRPDRALIQMQCLRSMQQAVYSPDNVGHFGLAYPAYAHFTSPIRRYPDLLTHRAIKALLARRRYHPAGEGDTDDARWSWLGTLCSARERRADEASRDVEAWLKCWYARGRVGEQFTGRVTGVASFGLFVTLDDLYVEGMVHISELGQDYFQFDEATHSLRGERTGMRYQLTDPVVVQIARVDLESRRIEFRFERSANDAGGGGSRRRRSGGGR